MKQFNSMRIEVLIIVVAAYALALSACSQPEPVTATYVPADCRCAEHAQGEAEEASAEESNAAPPVAAVAAVAPVAKRPGCEDADEGGAGDKSPGDKNAVARAKKTASPAKKTVKKEAAPKPEAAAKKVADGALVDLNTASLSQLLTLPGVGPALAARILNYREKRRFDKPAHLMRVKGIGKAKFAKMAGRVVVNSPVASAK